MPPLKILIWSKWPDMVSPTEDDNYLGIRLRFTNLERSKKRRNPEDSGVKITEEQVEVGIYQID